MPHTYKFADAENRTVVRDDGATFPWPVGDTTTPGAVGAALGGFVGEDYRTEGCPMPDAFGAKVMDKTWALKLTTGKPKRRRKGKTAKSARAGKFAKPVDADMHPSSDRKPPSFSSEKTKKRTKN